MTNNFKREEFACRCGCGLNMISPTVVLICQMIRDTYQQPVVVTSGCRCNEHNTKIGGAGNSQHTPKGDGYTHAVDIKVKNIDPKEVYDYLDEVFPNSLGLGLYSSWIHIDDRMDRKYRWNNR